MFWLSAIKPALGAVPFRLTQRKCGVSQLDYVNETRGFVMEPGFPSQAVSCENVPVKRSIHLCRLLAVFLIVGLVFAPLAARANANPMASMATASMVDETPCCTEQSLPADCADCPLMAICMVKTLQAQPSATVAGIQPVTLRMLLPVSDPEAESLGLLPPPKPPRSLVRPA
jgi:hypothetical protein